MVRLRKLVVSGALAGAAGLTALSGASACTAIPGPPSQASLTFGVPGEPVDISGQGWDEGVVDIRWDAPAGVRLGTATGRSFGVTVTVPKNAGIHRHFIYVIQPRPENRWIETRIPFEVVAPAPAPPTTISPTPSTSPPRGNDTPATTISAPDAQTVIPVVPVPDRQGGGTRPGVVAGIAAPVLGGANSSTDAAVAAPVGTPSAASPGVVAGPVIGADPAGLTPSADLRDLWSGIQPTEGSPASLIAPAPAAGGSLASLGAGLLAFGTILLGIGTCVMLRLPRRLEVFVSRRQLP